MSKTIPSDVIPSEIASNANLLERIEALEDFKARSEQNGKEV